MCASSLVASAPVVNDNVRARGHAWPVTAYMPDHDEPKRPRMQATRLACQALAARTGISAQMKRLQRTVLGLEGARRAAQARDSTSTS
jgi:hypothetical protein